MFIKHKKHKLIVVGVVTSFVISGSVLVLMNRLAVAVTDTCTGVNTTFTGSAPTSVVAGKSFTISNITSKPDSSYGFTVTSSTLAMSATNATPTTYNQNNTSTDPSPTTGAQTYTAYFPNWALTASGAAGSTITVKLTGATAEVSGIGSISCPLSATLATIAITAAPSSGGSASGSSGGAKTTTPTTTPKTETPADTATPSSQTEDSGAQTNNQVANVNVSATTKPSHTKRKIILSSIILLFAAIGAVVLLILYKRTIPKNPPVPTIPVQPPPPTP